MLCSNFFQQVDLPWRENKEFDINKYSSNNTIIQKGLI